MGLSFFVHYYPAADASIFVYKLVCAWLVVFLRNAANQHRFGLGIRPRAFGGDKLVNHV